MTNEELLEELWCTVCDLCHWPYVYQDKDVMAAEKCSYCPAINLLERLKRGLQKPTVTTVALTRMDTDAVRRSISRMLEEMELEP